MPGAGYTAHPRRRRLTRSRATITGPGLADGTAETIPGGDSADGPLGTQVDAVQLTGLPSTVQAGMFATSPGYTVTQDSFGGSSDNGGPAQATGVFHHVRL